MRQLPALLVALLLLGLVTVVVSQKQDPPAAAEPLQIFFLHGGKSHGSGAHEHRAGSHLLAQQLEAQSAVPVDATVIAGWPNDESQLDRADSIVIYCDATSVTQKGGTN